MSARTNRTRQHRKRAGQLYFIEFAICAIGLVVISFVAVKVGAWLVENLWARDSSFEGSRSSADDFGAGYAVMGGAELVNLVGNEPEHQVMIGNATPQSIRGEVTACTATELRNQLAGARATRRAVWTNLDQAQIPLGQAEGLAGVYDAYIKMANQVWNAKLAAEAAELDRNNTCQTCPNAGPFCGPPDGGPTSCPGECPLWGRTCLPFNEPPNTQYCCCVQGFDGPCIPNPCPNPVADCACWDQRQASINADYCAPWAGVQGPDGHPFLLQTPYGPACESNYPPECSSVLGTLVNEIRVYAEDTYTQPILNRLNSAYSYAEAVFGDIAGVERAERNTLINCRP